MVADDCFFCLIAAGKQEQECVIYRDEHIVVFPGLHQRPQNQAHIEVVTCAHVPTLYELDDDLAARVAVMSRKVALALKAEYGADGITIHQHNEAAGGQHVDHYHMHVVPRYTDDQYWASVGIREHEFLTTPRALLEEQARRLRAHFS